MTSPLCTSFSPGGTTPPTHLQTLETTSPLSRHPRLHGSFSELESPARAPRPAQDGPKTERHSEPGVKSTSSEHTGVGEIRLTWDAATDGLALEGGAIPSELLGAESRTIPIPLFPSWRTLRFPRLLYSHPRCYDTKDTASMSRLCDKLTGARQRKRTAHTR